MITKQSLFIHTKSNLTVADFHANERQSVPINLRNDDKFAWQLQIMPNEVAQPLEIYKDKVKFTFAPLDRHQRVQTVLASRPQAGKKLYQTLGIPSWLRESLVVVSVTSINETNIENEHLDNERPITCPILLLSPFESWVLAAEQSSINVDVKQLAALIESHLILRQTC